MRNLIENNDSFMSWCKQVNHSTTAMCDLQDDFAGSDIKELKALFVDMGTNDKHKAVFCINKAMGAETLLQFINSYSLHKAESYIEEENTEVNERWNKLLKAETDFRVKKEKLVATISNLEHRNKELTKDSDIMSNEIAAAYSRNHALDSEVEELHVENKRLYKFESHIKTLLNA
jgi:hypothetical protein